MRRCTTALSIFIFICEFVIALSSSAVDLCVSLAKSPFEMCMKAGYDTTVPFPEDFTEILQQETTLEMKEFFKQVKNCLTNSLAETIEKLCIRVNKFVRNS